MCLNLSFLWKKVDSRDVPVDAVGVTGDEDTLVHVAESSSKELEPMVVTAVLSGRICTKRQGGRVAIRWCQNCAPQVFVLGCVFKQGPSFCLAARQGHSI
jgi:hypothetical protein